MNGSRFQSSRLASTTSICASSRIGLAAASEPPRVATSPPSLG
ncbi:Uncharacterised protein [Mycobacteroides abscessus subsp. abscessus]|nr:Uncharacterised protein [Mycobacteroides abscessus subsp. abscessus]